MGTLHNVCLAVMRTSGEFKAPCPPVCIRAFIYTITIRHTHSTRRKIDTDTGTDTDKCRDLEVTKVCDLNLCAFLM